MEIGTEERRVAIEAIATLVHIKHTMVNLILKPAGIPVEVYGPLLTQLDPATKKPLSKRQMAPLIIDVMEKRPGGSKAVIEIIKIAAGWSEERYHLAEEKEYEARAVVQKARSLLGTIRLIEQQEARQHEKELEDERIRRELEKERQRQTRELEQQQRAQERAKQEQLRYLLTMFTGLLQEEPQRRGYQLEQLLNLTFDHFNIPIYEGSFRRNQGGEQIDGAFRFDGWFYLVECKWHAQLTDTGQTDVLKAKVGRSGKQAMGLFLSINGWTGHVPEMLKQNPEKCILLMNGEDLYGILSGQVSLQDLLVAKLTNLTLRCEPYYGLRQYLEDHQ